MGAGQKHVERIPEEWVEQVRRRVQAGRAFKEAVAEVFTANALLLAIAPDFDRSSYIGGDHLQETQAVTVRLAAEFLVHGSIESD